MSKESSSSKFLSSVYNKNYKFHKNSQHSHNSSHENCGFNCELDFSKREQQITTQPQEFGHLIPTQTTVRTEQATIRSNWIEEFNPHLNQQELHIDQQQHLLNHGEVFPIPYRPMMHNYHPHQSQMIPHQLHQPIHVHVQDHETHQEISQEVWNEEFEKMKLTSAQDEFDNSMNDTTDWKQQFEEMWEKSRLDKTLDHSQFGFDHLDQQDFNLEKEFTFLEDNPYLQTVDPYQQAMELKAKNGDLNTITLLLEASLRDNPTPEAWYELGLVCAENENETKGLDALQECLKLDKNFKKAMIAMGVALVNEGNHKTNQGRNEDALEILSTWAGLDSSSIPSFLKLINPTVIDPDLQIALGLVYYTQQDYEKTISCFSTALSTRPGDYLLWSRLGATMSNSGNNEGAIEAYYKSLEIKPTFVRGWYNLGVSCMNLGCYEEASKHFLKALGMAESRTVWDTLYRNFVLMDRRDLAEIAAKGDLKLFNGVEF